MGKKEEKNWKEAELITTFHLKRLISTETPKMKAWIANLKVILNETERVQFERIYARGVEKIAGWSEEDLKMKFISPILDLGNILEGDDFVSFFEKSLEGDVEGCFLKVKTDFVVAKGLLNVLEIPYFHFQEYKPHLNPTGEPMAQLLEAFLIAQSKNNNEKTLYGCEIIGANWRFVTMEGKTYCISKAFNCTDKDDLLQIIAILRKFRHILKTELL